jgi:hypothetical protein
MENSTTNCSNAFTEPEYVDVAIAADVAAGVSLLAGLFALFIIVLFKKWQSFGQRLITYLFITSAFYSVALILRRVDFDDDFTPADERFCAFSGFIAQVTIWFLVDTIVAITVYLFLGVVFNRVTDKYEWLYVLFIFVVPLVFGWIPFIHNTYGRAGVWCWIKLVDYTTCEKLILGQVLQLAMLHVPNYILFPTMILAYLITICKLSRNRKHLLVARSGEREEAYKNLIVRSETLHLLVYPLLFVLLGIPSILLRVQLWIYPNLTVLTLWYLRALIGNSGGLPFVLAFLLLDKDTRSRLKWTQMRAAIRNYHASKGVSEYSTDVVTEGEVEGGSQHKVSYRQLSDNSFLEML